MVGAGERDQRASRDAFEVLDLIVERRMRRLLTTVIDSTGLDAPRREAWRGLAERHGVPAYAVVFDPPAAEVRERNRARGSPVPSKVVTGQLRESADVFERLEDEGFAAVHRAGPVELVPPAFLTALDAAERQKEDPMTLEFGLQVSRFGFPGHPASTAEALADVARAAEETGFTSLWVMDHFLQIPQIGREWEDMLESYTTLGYLAGVTERIRLGTLVTGTTYRHPALLAMEAVTVDHVSAGRLDIGLSLGWLPSYGFTSPFMSFQDALVTGFLPALAIAAPMAAVFARTLRTALLENMRRDHVTVARAFGYSQSFIFRQYVFRNSIIPYIVIVGLQIRYLLGGVVVIERVFGVPGVGSLMVDAAFARDYPVVQACTIVFLAIVLSVNLMVDIVCAWLDPKRTR
jgi:hypothetical protein